jgi:hypothetical protein
LLQIVIVKSVCSLPLDSHLPTGWDGGSHSKEEVETLKLRVTTQNERTSAVKRRRSGDSFNSSSRDDSLDGSLPVAASQPEAHLSRDWEDNNNGNNLSGIDPAIISFSQPAALDDMLLSSQIFGTQNSQSSQTPLQRLVRRMTRFVLQAELDQIYEELSGVFKELEFTFKRNNAHLFTVSTSDRRKKPLVFKATLIELETKDYLCDFRLSKGDGLEFKKYFCKIRSKIKPVILKEYSFMM